MGSIESVWRYPAKSMMGDSFSSVPVDERGVTGDRAWAVRDEVRGGIRGAKKIGGLMRLHARYVEEPQTDGAPPPIEVTAPDGQRVRSDDDDVHERLSGFLEHKVTLWPLQPKEDLDHYRRGAPDTDDPGAEVRAMFGREPDEPLPTFEGIPLDVLVEYESPPERTSMPSRSTSSPIARCRPSPGSHPGPSSTCGGSARMSSSPSTTAS